MKNFVIATVSAVALLSVNAYAQDKSAETQKAPAPIAVKKEDSSKAKAMKKHGKKHSLAVYVNYPPVNVAALNECPCEYYEGKQECSYVWHEGYFWYPQAQAEMLTGCTPHFMRGSYWYPSRHHPHMVYVYGKGMPHDIYPVKMKEAGKKAPKKAGKKPAISKDKK